MVFRRRGWMCRQFKQIISIFVFFFFLQKCGKFVMRFPFVSRVYRRILYSTINLHLINSVLRNQFENLI